MANTCSCCKSERHAALDARILAREPLLKLVDEFGLSYGALHRHKTVCIAEAFKKADVTNGDSIRAQAERLLGDCRRLADKAEQAKGWGGAASALREARGCLELLAKLTGELGQRPPIPPMMNFTQVNVSAGPETDREIAMLIAAVTNDFDAAELERLKLLASEAVISPRDIVTPKSLIE